MMNDMQKAALPPYAELTKAIEAQTKVNKEQAIKQETCIIMLSRMCDLKEAQAENDCVWRGRWLKARMLGLARTVTTMALIVSAVYFEVVKVDKDNAMVAAGAAFVRAVLGALL